MNDWLILLVIVFSILLDKTQTQLQEVLDTIWVEAGLSYLEELISDIVEYVSN